MADRLGSTPSQTVGPFLSIALPWPDGPDVVAADHPDAVVLRGRVTDGAGDPVPDGLVEIWQADGDGRFDGGVRGFGRCPTDPAGEFWFRTVPPGPVRAAGGTLQAPHADLSVFCRGLLNRVVTRVYFPAAAAVLADDPLLSGLPEELRARLVARSTREGELRFDVVLHGAAQTPFFDL